MRERDCVNKNVAGRTRAEYRQENREALNVWNRAYKQRPELKAHIAAQKREWQERPEVKERRNELARQRRQRKKQELLERAA